LQMSGMPSGQPYYAVLVSSPIALRSSRSGSVSHSRTGSRPAPERQKTMRRSGSRLSCGALPTTEVYQEWYVCETGGHAAIQGEQRLRDKDPEAERG